MTMIPIRIANMPLRQYPPALSSAQDIKDVKPCVWSATTLAGTQGIPDTPLLDVGRDAPGNIVQTCDWRKSPDWAGPEPWVRP